MQSTEHMLDKENVPLQCKTPSLKQKDANMSVKRNNINGKRNLNSILTPQNSRTPGNALRDITNSTQIVNNNTVSRPTAHNEKTPSIRRTFDNIEEILALPDDELPEIEYIPAEPLIEETLSDSLLDLAALQREAEEEQYSRLQEEINQFIWPHVSMEEEYGWAFQQIEYREDELRPCFMFDDIPPAVTAVCAIVV